MKNVILVLLVIATCSLSAQVQTEVVNRSKFGLLHCEQIKLINFVTGEKSCEIQISFRNMDYYVDSSEISLPDSAALALFKADLKQSIDYIELKQKDKSKLVCTNGYYSLVIHDFPNRIYMYDPEMGYTVMTMREANALLTWINSLK